MKSTQQVAPQHGHLLNTVAQSGRNIEPCVYSAAQRMADHAVSYAEKFLGDSCVAVNLLEEAAATVSEAIRAKEAEGIAPIRDMHRYLFRVFLRKVAEARRAEVQYDTSGPFDSDLCNGAQVERLDSQLLLDQILGHFDSVTREIILCRIEGHSWGEIASEFGLSNHAARVRFSKALGWLRSSVETMRNGSVESTSPRTRKYSRPRDRKAQKIAAFERRLDRIFTPVFYQEFHQFLRATQECYIGLSGSP